MGPLSFIPPFTFVDDTFPSLVCEGQLHLIQGIARLKLEDLVELAIMIVESEDMVGKRRRVKEWEGQMEMEIRLDR